MEEEELYDALDDVDSPPGEEAKANEVEEEPRDGPQQGAEGPTEVLPQEWLRHEDVGYTEEPNKQGPARRAEATFDDDENRPKEEQPEGTTKAKSTPGCKAAPEHRDAQGTEAATKSRATPEPSSQASKANPQLMLQTGFLAALCLLLQPDPQATSGLPGRV